MNNLNEFLEVFFTTDYFLILLIILLLIVLVITVHLIRIQSYLKNENVFLEEEDDPIENEELLTSSLNEVQQEKPQTSVSFDSIEKLLCGEDESIERYEKDEEESAIISTAELEKITQDKDFVLGNNEILINQYEAEQEKKAIISYEELLKNASSLKLNYKDETVGAEGPIVRKIELETPAIERNLNYIEETNFLSTLKEFRTRLK